MEKTNSIEERVDAIFSLYEKYGSADYIGEDISQIEHMAQSAQMAEKEGFDDEVILAAFFHDIGHICEMDVKQESMGGYGVVSHERLGANCLREKGFSEKIAKLVENHVEAKRYLTFKDQEYFNKLSEASKKTLEYQGGPMHEAEAIAFEKSDLFEASIKLREWDEKAKEVGIPVPDLQPLRDKCIKHLKEKVSA